MDKRENSARSQDHAPAFKLFIGTYCPYVGVQQRFAVRHFLQKSNRHNPRRVPQTEGERGGSLKSEVKGLLRRAMARLYSDGSDDILLRS